MNQGPEEHYAHTMCNCSRCLLRCWCAHSCRYQNCLWIFGKQPATWIDTDAIMLDDTLLLTVCGLMIVIMTSCAHCHTIIHIQSYNHTHTIMQWCCTRVYETFLWKAVPIPGLCACIGTVQQIDCRIPGLCACHLCSLLGWWLDPWSLPLPPAVYQIVCQIFCLCACDLARSIFKMLVSAPPAARAVYRVYGIVCQNFFFCACHLAVDQVDFENVGVCACHPWSSRDWLSDPWALRLPPVQFTRLMVRSLVSALRLPPGSLPGWFSKCRCPRLPPVESGGVQRVDCRIPGLPATRAIYESDGWIKLQGSNHHSGKLHGWQAQRPGIWQSIRFTALVAGAHNNMFKINLLNCSEGGRKDQQFENQFSQLHGWQAQRTRMVFAPASRAVPARESNFAFIATSLSPCHLCRRASLNPRRRDGSIYHFRLCSRRFALVVFRLVRLRIVPFSVPCCPS